MGGGGRDRERGREEIPSMRESMPSKEPNTGLHLRPQNHNLSKIKIWILHQLSHPGIPIHILRIEYKMSSWVQNE